MSGPWKGLLILLSCACCTGVAPPDFNPHTPIQQIWEVLNEEGNIVWATTAVHPPWTWWPDLTPDICKLAAGSLTWDLPDHTDLSDPPPEERCVPNGIGSTYGCSGQFYRANLRAAEFYVCPGQGQSRRLRQKCGGASRFFCGKWGCETTGHAFWNPSSAWDLITVKRGSDHDGSNQGERDSSKYPESGCAHKNSPSGPCKGKYCNPLLIKFTEKGRQDRQSWLKGNRWGWRVYAPSRDPGFIFKIRLTVGDPAVAPIGPNTVLLEQGPPAKSKSLTQMPAQPMGPSYTDTLTPTTALQNPLTVAPTNPSTGQRMFNLVRGAFYALNRTNPDATEDCWLCLSSGPPYYEGIAFNGDFNKTSSHTSCSWGTGQKLTLTKVSARNPGLCIGTPPPTHKHLCAQIQSVSKTETNYYLVPSPVGWWACNTGLTPCVSTKVFESSHDFCVMIQLLPRVYYHSASSLEEIYAGTRFKKEPVTLTLATFLGIGMAVGVGTGVSALIEGRQGIQSLRDAVNVDLEMLEKSIDVLEKSLSSLSEVVLQNRRGLDLLFLKEGGLCTALKEECCFYADHTGIVRDSMQKREKDSNDKSENERPNRDG